MEARFSHFVHMLAMASGITLPALGVSAVNLEVIGVRSPLVWLSVAAICVLLPCPMYFVASYWYKLQIPALRADIQRVARLVAATCFADDRRLLLWGPLSTAVFAMVLTDRFATLSTALTSLLVACSGLTLFYLLRRHFFWFLYCSAARTHHIDRNRAKTWFRDELEDVRRKAGDQV